MQLLLAALQTLKDRGDVALRAGVAVEVVLDLVAEGDDPEDLARTRKRFDIAAAARICSCPMRVI
jgi:hypothetical protein